MRWKVTPISSSPLRIAQATGTGPRWRGSSDGCPLSLQVVGTESATGAIFPRVTDYATARRLRLRLDYDLVDVHVERAREREHDALGDVVGLERVDALVHRVRLRLVALEPDDRELGLREPGVDGGEADRSPEQVLAQRIREAAHGELRRDVGRRALIRLAPRDGAEIDDVAAVADVRKAQPR